MLNFLVFCPLWRKVESINLKLVSYQLSVGGSKSMYELLKLLTRWRVTSSTFLHLSALSNLWNSDEFYWFFACPRESYQGKFCFSNMIFVLLINYCYLPCSIIHRNDPCCRIQRLTLNFLVFCPLWRKVESINLKLVSYQLSVGGSKSMHELLKLLTR